MASKNMEVLISALKNNGEEDDVIEAFRNKQNYIPTVGSSVRKETEHIMKSLEDYDNDMYKQSCGWNNHKSGHIYMKKRLQQKLQDRKKN